MQVLFSAFAATNVKPDTNNAGGIARRLYMQHRQAEPLWITGPALAFAVPECNSSPYELEQMVQ